MANIDKQSPKSGNYVGSDNNVNNVVDLVLAKTSGTISPLYEDATKVLDNQPAENGNFINGEGNVENIVDILIGEETVTPLYEDDHNILNTTPIRTGNMVASDGKVYNMVDLLKDMSGGGATIHNQDLTVTTNGEYEAEEGYTGLGTVTVNVPTVNNENKTITENGTYTAGSGYTGLGTVTVNVSGGGSSFVPSYSVDSNGEATKAVITPTANMFADIVTVPTFGMVSTFSECSVNGTLTFPNLTTVGQQGCLKMFLQSTYDNTKPTTVLSSDSFPELTTIGNQGMTSMFYNMHLTGNLTFPKLTSIDVMGLGQAFNNTNITSISFPALTSTGTNAFYNMLVGVTGCALHFPAAMQGRIIANWGGTSTTVAYDL